MLPAAWGQPGRGAGPQGAPLPQGQNPNGMHVYIWAGLKSHPEGQHDYPQFLADWSKLLTERGAVVDGALHSPGSADLEHADVVVIYKGDAAYLTIAIRPRSRRSSNAAEDWSVFTTPYAVRIRPILRARGRRQEARRGELHAWMRPSTTSSWTSPIPS